MRTQPLTPSISYFFVFDNRMAGAAYSNLLQENAMANIREDANNCYFHQDGALY